MTSVRAQISQTLKDLAEAEKAKPGYPLFRSWYTAGDIAKKVGCSDTTARKYLEALSDCRGFAKRRFGGNSYGYRYSELP